MANDLEKRREETYRKRVGAIATDISPSIHDPVIKTGPGLQPKYGSDIDLGEVTAPATGVPARVGRQKRFLAATGGMATTPAATEEVTPKTTQPYSGETGPHPLVGQRMDAEPAVRNVGGIGAMATARVNTMGGSFVETPLKRRFKQNAGGPTSVWSSEAWRKTIDGQPNTGYDPNAIQPAGYYNEAGTFIGGPRIKPWELLRDASSPEARDKILVALAGKAGEVPEGTGIGPEKDRALLERLENIKASALKAVAQTQAGADIGVAERRGPYNVPGETSYAPKGFTSYTDPATQKRMVFNKDTGQFEKAGGGVVSQKRLTELKSKYSSLKPGKERDDFLDSLTQEEYNAVEGVFK